jgi:hypothetical protein
LEEFLKNKYGIDINARLSNEPKSYRVKDLVRMLRERGTEQNVIYNLHNGALNKEQALIYLDNVINQLTMECNNLKEA